MYRHTSTSLYAIKFSILHFQLSIKIPLVLTSIYRYNNYMESFKKHVQAQEGYDQLRRLLMTGQVAPGSRIGEVEWSKRLDVHRPALREAMRVLAHEGLLEVGEKGGFFVPVLDDNDLREILETRAVIEAGAIRKITSEDNQTDEQFQPLANICELMETL